jgi:small subunit ribosomal protein S6e
MASFKFVISEPQSRKSYQLELDQAKAIGLLGKKIGEEFNGDLIGLNGYTLQITGGTDKDGFPMHPQVKGQVRKKILLSNPPGFHPTKKGERKRKIVRGDTLSADIMQINVKVAKKGEKPIEQIFPQKAKAEKKEETKEEKKEQKVEEKKEVKVEKTEEKKEVKEEPKAEIKAGGEQNKK